MNKKINTCIVTTSSEQVDNFILPYIEFLTKNEKILIISNSNSERYTPEVSKNIQFEYIPFTRKPNIKNDLTCLLLLIRLLYKYKPSITYSINPKTGFITALAASINFIPKRIHMITGQVWVTKKGIDRWLFKQIDKVVGKFCTNLIVDSQSQLDFLVEEKILNKKKATILGAGSISGVDIEKFKMDSSARDEIRKKHNINPDDVVTLFLGRMTKDKGVFDLLNAFEKIYNESQNTRLILLFVGPDEGIADKLHSLINKKTLQSQVQIIGPTSKPQAYFNAADVFCLPSYREGFGQVVIEAACSKIPTVGSRIYGLTDAVVENETGLLHEVKNVNDLVLQLSKLMKNKELREQLGKNAYDRVMKEFSEEAMVEAFSDFHRRV